MKQTLTTDRRTPVQVNPQHPAAQQSRDAHRPFDYGVGYGNRSGYSAGRRYADVPGRGLFHCA